uniref:Uncharacterized protein n=1 Tax=Parascaris univalens TaxID=6257 RepID=A0A915B849_PARUN
MGLLDCCGEETQSVEAKFDDADQMGNWNCREAKQLIELRIQTPWVTSLKYVTTEAEKQRSKGWDMAESPRPI